MVTRPTGWRRDDEAGASAAAVNGLPLFAVWRGSARPALFRGLAGRARVTASESGRGSALAGGVGGPAKLYKLKHLSKVEVIQNDPSGCTFMGFDNLRSQSVAPSQWTMRNKDDRNRLLLCILNMSKEVLGRLPKVVGMDIVEMALWAKENTPVASNRIRVEGGLGTSILIKSDSQVTVEKELVSQAEEEDMETLLGTYVMGVGEAEAFSERMKLVQVLQGLEGASICVEDMDEWLGIFNVKLRHMREDIESIEVRNNKLELHSANYKILIYELDKLIQRLHIPNEFAAILTGGSFDEPYMVKNIEACEWLTGAINRLQVPNLDPSYANMQAVKEKRAELEKSKKYVCSTSLEFLRNYFSGLVDFMINDKKYFSQRGVLKRPDHADLRYKCRTYARLLQHLKSLDKNSLVPLRKAYCHSLNLLLRREGGLYLRDRDGLFVNMVPSRSCGFQIDSKDLFRSSGPVPNSAETAALSDAYSKMLTVFIPLLVDESYSLHLLPNDWIEIYLTVYFCPDRSSSELGPLNDSLQELLDGIQEDFYSLVDWAFKADPLRCISMHGITERYLSGQKADTAGFVRLLLDDLETRISINFGRFVDDCIYMIEKTERNARQMGVLPYIPRFSILATRMEQYIQGQSRDLVDQTYTKIVSIMFVCLERTAQMDPKYADIVLLENYAAFQNSLYDLANVVPTLAKFYHQASESYDQACTRHINMVIFITFERLFLFARRIEELMFNISPEEIQFQAAMSKADLRKMLKASLSGV
ncbi:hypothetical protein HPP92_006946 [Vanilla planifolia]|uniref:Exocyst complex component Sec3 PIP2-binding N-terminal domain-containing protein n=1 Tax=Vanilla planifolia TaxID=51239 RepID=A0A835R9K2_VANPL|nr:hypothetical protein HPP92_006946 [Vanilla planifolia]